MTPKKGEIWLLYACPETENRGTRMKVLRAPRVENPERVFVEVMDPGPGMEPGERYNVLVGDLTSPSQFETLRADALEAQAAQEQSLEARELLCRGLLRAKISGLRLANNSDELRLSLKAATVTELQDTAAALAKVLLEFAK